MVRQEFSVDGYWKVIVYYDVDYDLWDTILQDLLSYHFSKEPLTEMYYTMKEDGAKAVTCSNIYKHVSFVLFNKHISKEDYLNSLVHEAEHVKQSMLEAYQVEDKGEPPAYTIGYLVMRMYSVFKQLATR